MPDTIFIPNFPRGGGMVSFFTSTFIQTQSWWKNPENEKRKIEISTCFTDILERVKQNDPTISQSTNILDISKKILDSMDSKIDYLIEDNATAKDRTNNMNKAIDDFVKKKEQKYITENSSMFYGQAEVTKQQKETWKQERRKKFIYQKSISIT